MKNNQENIAQTAQEETGKKAPVKRIRLNDIQVSIWRDPYQDNKGTIRERYTGILDRSYLDATGTRKYTRTLGIGDMTDAIYALQKSVEYILEEKEQKQQEASALARQIGEQHEVEIETVTSG